MARSIEGDAFGQALLARQEGRSGDVVSERDDGLVELDSFDYFSPPQGPLWEWVVARVGHRILDIGAGTGREALALQAMGKEVLALDVSPGAIEVCRRRGVVSTFLGTVHDLAVSRPEPFDSCLAFNSLSLVFNPTDAVGLLDALSAVGHPDWALVGQEGAPGRRTPRAALSPPETRGRDHGCVDGRCHQGADGPHGALERGGCPAVPARRSRSGPSGSRRARHARGRSPNAR